LAAIAQAVAFLEFIEKGNRLAGQRDDQLMLSLRGKTAPIGTILVGGGILANPHGPSSGEHLSR
jgi:hypothetical protein